MGGLASRRVVRERAAGSRRTGDLSTSPLRSHASYERKQRMACTAIASAVRQLSAISGEPAVAVVSPDVVELLEDLDFEQLGRIFIDPELPDDTIEARVQREVTELGLDEVQC